MSSYPFFLLTFKKMRKKKELNNLNYVKIFFSNEMNE